MINTTNWISYLRRLKTTLRWDEGRSILWQVLGVLLALLYVAGLHLSNDGLWFQGDSPRHAANGLFWWDFLASFPVHPVKFAISYYARYPVIHPTAYPPGFYLIEGVAFRIFGASPFVAKGLVFAFALLACLYVTAWIRRWISEEAGWGGALLILQPGIIIWTNAVMLNVPSMALGVASLYHARRWIGTSASRSRHLYLTILFVFTGIFTYVPTGIVVFVILAWVVIDRRGMIFWNKKVLALVLLSTLILVPWGLVILRWAPTYFGSIYSSLKFLGSFSNWTYYLERIPALFSAPVLGLAMLGAVFGLRDSRWRQEVKLLLVWFFVCYIGFSCLRFREPRYILILGPPSVFLSIIGLVSLLQWRSAWFKRRPSWLFLAGITLLLLFHLSKAPFVKVPTVDGFQGVVAFLERRAPEEMIFYDGNFDGVLTFYLRARDQYFRRGVVLGSKLLYASLIVPFGLPGRGSSPAEVVEILRKESGCKWVVIERHGVAEQVPAARFLRQALTGPEFGFVKSFPIRAGPTTWVDVYQFLPPVEKPDKLNLFFPGLGKDAVFRVNPIEKSSKGIGR